MSAEILRNHEKKVIFAVWACNETFVGCASVGCASEFILLCYAIAFPMLCLHSPSRRSRRGWCSNMRSLLIQSLVTQLLSTLDDSGDHLLVLVFRSLDREVLLSALSLFGLLADASAILDVVWVSGIGCSAVRVGRGAVEEEHQLASDVWEIVWEIGSLQTRSQMLKTRNDQTIKSK